MHRRTKMAAAVLISALLFPQCLRAYEKEVQALSAAVAEQIAQSGKKTIAVVDFPDLQGKVTELGRFLAEEFSVRLAGAGKGFEVVDRAHLKSLLQEHKLAAAGLIDPATAKRLGQIAGVDALVTGSVTALGEIFHVAVKVLDTDSARVIGAAIGDIPRTQALSELANREIGESSPVAASPEGTGTGGPADRVQVVRMVANDYEFQSSECIRTGQTVACDFVVTNKSRQARSLQILARYHDPVDPFNVTGKNGSYSFAVDNLGNRYAPLVRRSITDATSYLLYDDLQSEIPVRFKVPYDGVAADAQSLNVILDCQSEGHGFRVVVRRLSIKR